MTTHRIDYYKEYYEKNKERILNSRKVRYKNDKTYREKIKRDRQETRKRFKKLEELKKKKMHIEAGEDLETLSGTKMKVSTPNGEAVTYMFTLGQVADILNVRKQNFLNWILANKVPESIYRDHRNWRLYTHDQVSVMKTIFDKENAYCQRNSTKLRMNSDLSEKIKDSLDKLEYGLKPNE